MDALRYGFVDMIQDTGRWLILGLVIAGLITVLVPDDFFLRFAETSLVSMLVMLAISIPMYVCATDSIPIAVALMLKGISLAGAVAVSSGIAIQNIPEGAIISMPMCAEGNSKWRSFLIGSLSGVVEPLGGLLVVLMAAWQTSILPYMLSFAAGAMCYVVVEELIPEASSGEHSNLSTIGFAIGFVLMMVLDVVMG